MLLWIGNFIVADKFSQTFRDVSFYFFPGTRKELFLFFELGTYLAIFFLVLGIWFYKRKIPEFGKDEVGMLFSSTNPPDLENQLFELQNKVKEQVKRRDLLGIFKIKTLPPNIIIDEMPKAQKLVSKANAALIVWGHFEKTKIRGHDVVGFPTLNFSYSHPANISQDYHKDVGLGLLGRTWIYGKENELVEKQLVVENIAQVSLNIVGMSLLVKGFLREAESIFSVLDVDLDPHRRNVESSPLLKNFCAKVRGNRVKAIASRVQREFLNIFRKQGMYHATSSELADWIGRLHLAIKLDKRDSRLYMMQATMLFLMDDLANAFKSLKRAKDNAPIAEPGPDFSSAFLHLYKGEFRKAKDLYRTGLSKKGSYNMFLITHIVEFIQQVLEKHQEKFQLHFALGLLNEERFDKQVAVDEYKSFLNKASSHSYYSRFVPEVEQKVARLLKDVKT